MMRQVAVTEYRDLMRSFYDGGMTAGDFETSYLRLFKEDAGRKPDAIFQILDGLFADVDAFSPDPALRGRDGIGADTLRARVGAALRHLERLV
jgi:hypothetical protein